MVGPLEVVIYLHKTCLKALPKAGTTLLPDTSNNLLRS